MSYFPDADILACYGLVQKDLHLKKMLIKIFFSYYAVFFFYLIDIRKYENTTSINCISSSDSKYFLAFLSAFLQSPTMTFVLILVLNASRRVFRTDKRLACGLDRATSPFTTAQIPSMG